MTNCLLTKSGSQKRINRPSILLSAILGVAFLLSVSLAVFLAYRSNSQSADNRSQASSTPQSNPNIYFVPTENDQRPETTDVLELGVDKEASTSISKVGKVEIRIDPNGHQVIGADLTLMLNPNKLPYLNLVSWLPNRTQFGATDLDPDGKPIFLSQALPLNSETGYLRLLLLTKQGETITQNGSGLGTLQMNFTDRGVAGDAVKGWMAIIVLKAEIVTPDAIITLDRPYSQSGQNGKYRGELQLGFVSAN